MCHYRHIHEYDTRWESEIILLSVNIEISSLKIMILLKWLVKNLAGYKKTFFSGRHVNIFIENINMHIFMCINIFLIHPYKFIIEYSCLSECLHKIIQIAWVEKLKQETITNEWIQQWMQRCSYMNSRKKRRTTN